jgi:hypothetical protein
MQSERRIRIASIAFETFAMDDWTSVRLSHRGFPDSSVIAVAIGAAWA